MGLAQREEVLVVNYEIFAQRFAIQATALSLDCRDLLFCVPRRLHFFETFDISLVLQGLADVRLAAHEF